MTVLKKTLYYGPGVALLTLIITLVVAVFYFVPSQYEYLITIFLVVLLTAMSTLVAMGVILVKLIQPADAET